MNCNNKQKVSTIFSLIMSGVGIGLLIFMIIVENEPGAVPLILILLGAGWFLFTRVKMRQITSKPER